MIVPVQELKNGVWHWQTRHPWWQEGAPYPPEVSSYAIERDDGLLLFDPLGVPDELAERASGIVLTAPWHERDTVTLVDRFGLPVHAPAPDTAEDLMETFGITREQAGDGSPDLRWLRESGADFDRFPEGIEAFAGRVKNDLVLYVESHRAVVAGDSIADFGDGLTIVPGWLPKGVTRRDVATRLRPVLDREIELVLPAHGEPTDRTALERVLAARYDE
jgi:hypothetical protein